MGKARKEKRTRRSEGLGRRGDRTSTDPEADMSGDGTGPTCRLGVLVRPFGSGPRRDTTATVPNDASEPVTPPLPVPLGDDDAPHTMRTSRRWSFGLLAVAVLRLADALNLTLSGLQVGGLGAGLPRIHDVPLTNAIELSVAALTVIGVIGLLGGRRWGWVLTM